MDNKKGEATYAGQELCTRLRADFVSTAEAAEHGPSPPRPSSSPNVATSPTDLSLFPSSKTWLLQPILTEWEQEVLKQPASDGYYGDDVKEQGLEASSSLRDAGVVMSSGLESGYPHLSGPPSQQPVWQERPTDPSGCFGVDPAQTGALTYLPQVNGVGPQASRSVHSRVHGEIHGNVDMSRRVISASAPPTLPLSISDAAFTGEERQMNEVIGSGTNTSSLSVSRQDHGLKYWKRGPGACSRCSKAKTRCEESKKDSNICARCEKHNWKHCNMIANRRFRTLRPSDPLPNH